MRNPEHHLQIACVNWFRMQYPKYYWHLFAIPNGGHRNIKVAAKMKMEGVISGVSDLFLAVPSGKSHGLFIELKVKPNKPTSNQITFGREMMGIGYHIEFVYNFESFMTIVNDWMNDV